MAEEVLSRLIQLRVQQEDLKPMKLGRRLKFPSHLLYADDVLMFCKASKDNAVAIKRALSEYGALSGQLVNPDKSHNPQ